MLCCFMSVILCVLLLCNKASATNLSVITYCLSQSHSCFVAFASSISFCSVFSASPLSHYLQAVAFAVVLTDDSVISSTTVF